MVINADIRSEAALISDFYAFSCHNRTVAVEENAVAEFYRTPVDCRKMKTLCRINSADFYFRTLFADKFSRKSTSVFQRIARRSNLSTAENPAKKQFYLKFNYSVYS